MKVIFLFMLLVTASTVSAQKLENPQKEFAISFSKNQLELTRGENGELEIQVLKSRSYQKRKIKMGVSSRLPKGVTITFDNDNSSFNSTKATIMVEPEAIPGQYSLILNATLNNKTRGSILKLLIRE